jgi:hypothetical protein
MEGREFFEKIGRVRAPDGFEESVLARLPSERERRDRQSVLRRYAFAGSVGVFLIGAVLAAVLVFNGGGAPGDPDSGLAAAFWGWPSDPQSVIPVLETVDYSAEVRNASTEPRTVYILEQVSEGIPSGIKY